MIELEETGSKTQGVRKLLKRYSGYPILVLDEWLLDEFDDRQISFVLELVERRYDVGSTIFCTQYHQGDWHSRLGGGVHADAIMDRIVHNCAWVDMGEFNMRKYISEQRMAIES